MNNKKFTKRGAQAAPLLFLYKVSIVVLIDFIAILLIPGIFLIQIVNTNMYLIHFHIKNIIKMHFPKSWVFKVQNRFRHFYSSERGEINCVDISKDFTTTLQIPICKKKLINNYYVHCSDFWLVFWLQIFNIFFLQINENQN